MKSAGAHFISRETLLLKDQCQKVLGCDQLRKCNCSKIQNNQVIELKLAETNLSPAICWQSSL